MNNKKIKSMCLISFSNNADHQNVIYSMYHALKEKAEVYTIGIINPKSSIACYDANNFYFQCPDRPGICKGTFRLRVLLDIVKIIHEKKIDYLYFESLHLWNALVMILCPNCVLIEAIHDVIPHDGNVGMELCNFVTSKLADHVILRNYKYKEILSKKCTIPAEKITCFELWRHYALKTDVLFTRTFLCFGRIRNYKGFDKLIDIIKRTPEISYRIVGSPDNNSITLVNCLKQFSNTIVIDKEVTDTEMLEEFKNADWIILPYTSATQSGVIADACRLSRPVIAFDVGAISEQVLDGKTGFLIPEANIDAFVQKIEYAASMSNQELEYFASQAYEYGYQKYSAEAVCNRFLDTIYQISK